ncbi:MAG: hypothetical protein HLUCCA11_08580 [Phormidesmis priestleyi Ana]|uniref:Uncharacterized protein n=1 Tax=Phormidesmis priestleyi Ana TaxID=1666911 RepID=A0A0P8C380_9CYAN|nr:MAG: hypothetical protein HLUCCA11_08580 [Phormidesmis priestleyi Ana]
MEPILIISNLVLIGLTGTYAWLTNKNVKQIQQESAYYRSVVEKQLRFTALPHLYWDLRPALSPSNRLASTVDIPTSDNASLTNGGLATTSTGLALEVFNISNVPAYDVHVSIIGAYTEEGMGIATFMRTYVQSRHRKFPLQADKVGYYGVRSAVRLSLLPTQQKIVLTLPFPKQPVDVYTLVQYRELSGENYYQVCCFSAIDESGSYRANILEPTEIQFMERLHLFDAEDFTLPDDSKEDFPYYLADFIDLWNHSISSRLISDAPASPEEEVSVKATYDF